MKQLLLTFAIVFFSITNNAATSYGAFAGSAKNAVGNPGGQSYNDSSVGGRALPASFKFISVKFRSIERVTQDRTGAVQVEGYAVVTINPDKSGSSESTIEKLVVNLRKDAVCTPTVIGAAAGLMKLTLTGVIHETNLQLSSSLINFSSDSIGDGEQVVTSCTLSRK